MRTCVAAAVGLIAIAVLGGWSNAAAQAPIAVSGEPYELTESDGKHTLSITVTNATAQELTASLTPIKAQAGCDIEPDPSTVAPNRSVAVKFTLPEVCDLGAKKTDFTLALNGAGTEPLSVPLSAATPKEKKPEFERLNAYWYCALGMLLVIGLIGLLWERNVLPPKFEKEKPADPDPPKRHLLARLPGLAADWSFKDSWSSNVSLAAAIFTGVLGASTVLKDILGKDHEKEVTLAVLSAAVSAGLIGAAPLILAIFRWSWSKDRKDRSRNTVLGVLLATHLVLTAAAGQIVVMAVVLSEADVIDDKLVVALAVGAGVALVAYAIQTVPLTIADGLIPPPKDPTEIEALDRVAAAILKVGGPNGAAELANLALDYPWVDDTLRTSPGDTEEWRPRSAMP